MATPDVMRPMIAPAYPEIRTAPLAATSEGSVALQNLAHQRFDRLEENKTVLAVGPGLGLYPETQEFIRKLALQTELPLILDADGLNAFAGNADVLRDRKTKFRSITPHPAEMARLLMRSTKDVQEDRVKTAQNAARRCNVHVI